MRRSEAETYGAATNERSAVSRGSLMFALALAAAGLYATTGAIELAHNQPRIFADAIDYWLEAAFVAALALSTTTLVILARAGLHGPLAVRGWAVAAAGHGCLLVAALATLVAGRELLDALFVVGFLATLGSYLLLAVLDAGARIIPGRAGFVFLAGFALTVAVDNVVSGTGGLVLGMVWAAFARLLSTSYELTLAGRTSPHPVSR
jgi:hypothetical protein